MKTVTLEVASKRDVTRRALEAFGGKRQRARISFATPELLWNEREDDLVLCRLVEQAGVDERVHVAVASVDDPLPRSQPNSRSCVSNDLTGVVGSQRATRRIVACIFAPSDMNPRLRILLSSESPSLGKWHIDHSVCIGHNG
jgi:hypothetical protein